MVDENGPAPAPARRRRLSAHGMVFRRRRVFARLREGFTYDEIATEEGVSGARIRQIVTEELQKRAVDSGADHAKLQLDRLAPALQLGAEAIAYGDVSAISPYLKAIDRLDRYQTVAGAHQAYDEDARKRLLQKINRMAENLGMDEAMWQAVRERAKAIREAPPDGLGEAEAEGAADAASPEVAGEESVFETSRTEAETSSGFLYLNRS